MNRGIEQDAVLRLVLVFSTLIWNIFFFARTIGHGFGIPLLFVFT